MSDVVTSDLKDRVLASGRFSADDVHDLIRRIAEDSAEYRLLREARQELEQREAQDPDTRQRLGVVNYLLGRFAQAESLLAEVDDAVAKFYLGKSRFALEKYDAAKSAYDEAQAAGYTKDLCVLANAETLRYANQAEESLRLLDDLYGPVEQTAEYLYQRGATVRALNGNPEEVVALFERAVEADATHPGALFGLALENDRRGNDETALGLYERSVKRFPPHVGSLLNLGLMYEERNQFDQAQRCYRRILDVFPGHPQARLFIRDAEASGDMFYDEEAQRRRDRLSQVLNVPVTDFELSVRSRNCLQKMGIHTLGDLATTTEQELLASKNFGETSLVEIKEILGAKGLRLGQLAEERAKPEMTFEPEHMTPDEQALLSQPIADLNLSVRARKCMVRLGISTIGELVRHTGDDLLECKNFGVTSLNEVREKLATAGLKLRGET